VGREQIATAIQRNTIQILRKILNMQVTLMSRITWGVVVYSALQKRYFLLDFPVIAGKVFWKGGGDY
jgi:type III secretory pathway component EscS